MAKKRPTTKKAVKKVAKKDTTVKRDSRGSEISKTAKNIALTKKEKKGTGPRKPKE